MRSIIFYLTIAPSVNASTFNLKNGGRAKTKAYSAWLKESLLELMAQRARPVETPVSISLDIPETSRLDVDNPIKQVCDLLVKAKIIPDDNKRFVRSVSATFYTGKRMRVTIQSLTPDP